MSARGKEYSYKKQTITKTILVINLGPQIKRSRHVVEKKILILKNDLCSYSYE